MVTIAISIRLWGKDSPDEIYLKKKCRKLSLRLPRRRPPPSNASFPGCRTPSKWQRSRNTCVGYYLNVSIMRGRPRVGLERLPQGRDLVLGTTRASDAPHVGAFSDFILDTGRRKCFHLGSV